MKKYLAAYFLTIVVSAAPLCAAPFIQWQSSNIQLLSGASYKAGDANRTIATIEHANAWTYGDFFLFTDLIASSDGSNTHYIEIAPRVSLSKLTGKPVSYGIIKDVLISTNFELPKGSDMRSLYGLAADLTLPGFKFFKTNLYVRDNPNLSGSTHQLTFVWNYPFSIGEVPFLIEGFADFAGEEGTAAANELIVPRFLMDLGSVIGNDIGTVFLGVEYSYWNNKFGIEGVKESNPQIQLKWVL